MSKGKKQQGKSETPFQARLFEAYVLMGPTGRSLRKLGAENNINPRRLFRISKRLNWQERVVQRDKEIEAELAKKTNATVTDLKEFMLRYWKALLSRCFSKDEKGNMVLEVVPKDVSDAERITKMILLLSGEVTDRREYVSTIVTKVLNVIELEVGDIELRQRIFARIGGIGTAGGSEETQPDTSDSGQGKP